MRQSDIDLVNMPTPNMPLLDAVIDKIEGDLDSWNQDTWGDIKGSAYQEEEPCGTTACFAGHAVIEAGIVKPVIERVSYGGTDYWNLVFVNPETGQPNMESIMDLAREALGITFADAEEIFFHFPTYDDDTDVPETIREAKELDLQWFKRKVEELRGRARQQEAAFNRIAEELIASVPELEEVLKPGYSCPESRQALLQVLDTFKGEA